MKILNSTVLQYYTVSVGAWAKYSSAKAIFILTSVSGRVGKNMSGVGVGQCVDECRAVCRVGSGRIGRARAPRKGHAWPCACD